MAYIGKQPVIGNFQVCDAISVVNNQAAYTMQVGSVNVSPETENHMLVSLNGILQRPGSSYTVSGSTITFASNLVTGDVIDFIQILGSVLDLGVPSDSTVSLAKLTATGTKDATTFLRGDNTFAAAGSPSITDNGNATAITIDSSENVGIGTSSPQQQLDVSSTGPRIRLSDTSVTNLRHVIGSEANDLEIRCDDGNVQADSHIGFKIDNSERMRINTTDVWIGSTDAFTGQGDKGAFLSSTGGIFDFARIVGGGSSVFRVSGDSGEMRVQGDGDLINTNNSYGAISDRELKENEVEANSQWNDIKALQIKNYNLKATPDIAHLGVIAQDLESSGMNGLVNNTEDELYTENDVLPEGKNIGDIKDKGYKSVKYSILYMKSIKALQEAMERIETLEAKVTQLENA